MGTVKGLVPDECFAHFWRERFLVYFDKPFMWFPIELIVLFQSFEILGIDFIFSCEAGVILDDDLHLSNLVDLAIVEIEFFEDGVDYLLILH